MAYFYAVPWQAPFVYDINGNGLHLVVTSGVTLLDQQMTAKSMRDED